MFTKTIFFVGTDFYLELHINLDIIFLFAIMNIVYIIIYINPNFHLGIIICLSWMEERLHTFWRVFITSITVRLAIYYKGIGAHQIVHTMNTALPETIPEHRNDRNSLPCMVMPGLTSNQSHALPTGCGSSAVH